jgi:hypothetical protein
VLLGVWEVLSVGLGLCQGTNCNLLHRNYENVAILYAVVTEIRRLHKQVGPVAQSV